jgi:archaellum component FlaC
MIDVYLSFGAAAISALTLLISYLAYRNKVSNDDNKQWMDQIRNLKDTEIRDIRDKIKEIRQNIADLYKLYNDTHTELSVLKERIANEIEVLEKLENKLGEIQEELRK